MSRKVHVQTQINGDSIEFLCEPRQSMLEVLRDVSRLRVQGVNMVKRHRRATQSDAGGIISIEAPLHISNVAHVDPEDGVATRVRFEFKDGKLPQSYKELGY